MTASDHVVWLALGDNDRGVRLALVGDAIAPETTSLPHFHFPSSSLSLSSFLPLFFRSFIQLNNLWSSYCVRHCPSGNIGKKAVHTTEEKPSWQQLLTS